MSARISAVLLVVLALSLRSQPAGDSITLERSECYGTCPPYLLRIAESGSVFYQSGPRANRGAELRSSIDPAGFDNLLAEFERIHFREFNASYEATHSDGVRTIVRLVRDGREKVVSHWDVAPPGLKELERQIERAVDVHQWLHSDRSRLSLESPVSGPQMGRVEDLKNERFVREDSYYRIKPGMTPLMTAAALGELAEVRRLIAGGVDLNARDETGWTALMFAAVIAQKESVAALLEAGAQVDIRDQHGDTALIGVSAIRFGNLRTGAEIVDLLLARGASVSETNDLGESALMWAARTGNPHTIKVLLDHGADPQQTDSAGHAAEFYLDSARQDLTFDPGLVQRYNQAAGVLQR